MTFLKLPLREADTMDGSVQKFYLFTQANAANVIHCGTLCITLKFAYFSIYRYYPILKEHTEYLV